MLSTMSTGQLDVSTGDQSYSNNRHASPTDSNYGVEDRLCPGCKKSAVNENGGLVVAFGQSFFHVDCFKCAKCRNQVTADTNLLLLSDGSPICANCSYSCSVCELPILDEAIMTGDDSYHAHCFKCKVCKSRIDELVFAKTTQGIYCMNCHSERMIKIRRHAQKKAERDKATGGGSSRSRAQEPRTHQKENGTAPLRDDYYQAESSRSAELSRRPSGRSPAERPSATPTSDAFESPSASSHATQISQELLRNDSYFSIGALPSGSDHSTSIGSPRQPVFSSPINSAPSSSNLQRPIPERQKSLPLTIVVDDGPDTSLHNSEGRRLNASSEQKRGTHEDSSPTNYQRPADILTQRSNKRHSINPALTSHKSEIPTRSNPSPSSSPSNMTFGSRTPTTANDPRIGSPKEQGFEQQSRRPAVSIPTHSPVSNNAYSSPAPSDKVNSPDLQKPPLRLASVNETDQASPVRSPRPPLTADKIPPRTHSLGSGVPSQPDAAHVKRLSPTVNAQGGNTLRPQRSFDDRTQVNSPPSAHRLSSRPSLNFGRSRSTSRTRMESRADVPHDIERGTETDGDANESMQNDGSDIPPALPPKRLKTQDSTISTTDIDLDFSAVSQSSADGSDELLESSTVQRTSHATFIAPALPPIRFSMTGADFADIIGPAGSNPPSKAMEQLAKLSEEQPDYLTPPSSASSFDGLHRPMSDITIMGSSENGTSENSFVDEDTIVQFKADDSAIDREAETYNTRRLPESQSYLRSHGISGSITSLPGSSTRVTITEPGSNAPMTLRQDVLDLVLRRLQEVLMDANDRGIQHMKMDKGFVEAILSAMKYEQESYIHLKKKFDGIRRTSKQYIEGLTVAQTEYDRELKARRDAQAEVTRLRVLISGQAARLTTLSGDAKRQEHREQLSKQIHDNLAGLEEDLSKLRVERDITLAEMEELSASKSNPDVNLSRSLTMRLEGIKAQYVRELIPLTQQRESLAREVAELKAVREVFLEETTVLSARNEELAQLSAQYARRMDTPPEAPPKESGSFDKSRPSQQSLAMSQTLTLINTRSSTYSDDPAEPKSTKVQKQDAPEFPAPASRGKFMKWPGSKPKEIIAHAVSETNLRGKAHPEHMFQQLSILRITRCDICGDKMWGSQVRCSVCHISIHGRCMSNVRLACSQQTSARREEAQNGPPSLSLFGRNLIDQVRSDSKGGQRTVPIIVEKCIEAVEMTALDYEGIYRKTGGHGQSKAITQLFEQGDYAAFDLRDSNRFNDICSVTSVLKTYFRSLPVPLLTFDLHDPFIKAVQIKDVALKTKTMVDLVNKLPREHYYTLRMLMLHLYHIRENSENNLMTSRNLGVVFGPTLMRSRDPGAEFSDMAGKALSIEWLVENAPMIFNQPSSN